MVGLVLYRHGHGQMRDIRVATIYQTMRRMSSTKVREMDIRLAIVILTKYIEHCLTSRFHKVCEIVGSTIYF